MILIVYLRPPPPLECEDEELPDEWEDPPL
jgi:hypothetical protein